MQPHATAGTRAIAALAVTLAAGLCSVGAADAPSVAVRAGFAGGNVKVLKNAPGVVHVAPDLRGDRAWFYWSFEAVADAPGRVRFVLPAKVAGHGGVGYQGPAISVDAGKTWRWMGAEDANANAFTVTFARPGQAVRLAVTIPYVPADLERFLKAHAGSPHLTRTVLTRSRKGRAVPLLRVGAPAGGRRALLVTCRHHACETMASFVLEGLLAAALADTPAGRAFRRQCVLYAVPFVDRDGVEDGDQGKFRRPHDHNRDYGSGSIYPEVEAIEKLADEHNVRFLLDLHCPTLRYGDHQALYFVGPSNAPAANLANIRRLAALIKAALPPRAPVGPLVWLKERPRMPTGSNCNRWFAYRPATILAATLEIPFAPPKADVSRANTRRIGAAIVDAWTKMELGPRK